MIRYPLDILDKGSTVKEQWEGRSMPGCWDLGRGTDRESPRAAVRREGRAAVVLRKNCSKSISGSTETLSRSPASSLAWELRHSRMEKLLPGSAWKAKLTAAPRGK